jgi:DNA-binding response OmpR family regulator
MPAVLLVDDSPVALHALAARLRAEGFDVRQESTAASARNANTEGLCCAVIDVDLSDGDGVAVATALRATRPSLPIAFFTAGAGRGLVEKAQEQGPVFAKPDLEAVAGWVRLTLRRRSERSR